MTFREFIDRHDINIKDFADACEIPHTTLRSYVGRYRTPNLRNSIKIIIQSGGLITMEDLLRKDQPLMRLDQPFMRWKPRRVKTHKKMLIESVKQRDHYRWIYFRAIDEL